MFHPPSLSTYSLPLASLPWRGNIPILLYNPTLHVCPYVLNRVEIRGIEWVLITSHFKLFSDKNTNRFVNRSIIFHHNWLFYISKRLFSELFAWSYQDLILIHCWIDCHLIFQIKKHSRSHFSPLKWPPEHHFSLYCPLCVVNTVRVELFISFLLYPVLDSLFHSNFNTHLICPDRCFSIIYTQMSIPFSKLQSTLAIKLIEKGLTSGYPIIIAKTLTDLYECVGMNLKLEVSDNGKSW